MIPTYKIYGEEFRLWCSSHQCTHMVRNINNFYKLNQATDEIEIIDQGGSLRKKIKDYRDAGIYCCAPQCAEDTRSQAQECCHHIGGIVACIIHVL